MFKNKSKEDFMFKRAFQLLLVAGLAASALWAANDPFVGQWKLTKYNDVMKVTNADANKYTFNFGGGDETIALDGTDQPGYSGTTLAVTAEGPNTWKVVRKQNGRMLLTATWNLSEDGNTLRDHYTEFAPNGSPSTADYVYKQTAKGPGFTGRWESMIEPLNEVIMLQVRPYEGDGLSFIIPSEKETTNLKLDGKDYPKAGSDPSKVSVLSSRRMNARTVEITNKRNGKITDTRQFQLSSDLKTLTMTVHTAGNDEPAVYVFERQ